MSEKDDENTEKPAVDPNSAPALLKRYESKAPPMLLTPSQIKNLFADLHDKGDELEKLNKVIERQELNLSHKDKEREQEVNYVEKGHERDLDVIRSQHRGEIDLLNQKHKTAMAEFKATVEQEYHYDIHREVKQVQDESAERFTLFATTAFGDLAKVLKFVPEEAWDVAREKAEEGSSETNLQA